MIELNIQTHMYIFIPEQEYLQFPKKDKKIKKNKEIKN